MIDNSLDFDSDSEQHTVSLTIRRKLLPSSNYKKLILEFIKNIENSLNKLHINKRLNIRNRIIPIINNLSSSFSQIL